MANEEQSGSSVSAAQFRALAVLVALLGVLAAATVTRFLAPLIVAAWFAGLTAGLRERLVRRIGGRHRVAAVATAALVVVIVAPMVLLVVPLVSLGVRFAHTLSRGNVAEAVARLATTSAAHAGRGAGAGA
ncbi:MAG: hypothetical protein JWM10_3037, partial [Myxococcaceae bacterium]|nr:hypothetical protein [Myxococcaceae bacterium]